MKFVHKFKYLALCLRLIKLLSISSLFCFVWITSSNSSNPQRPQPRQSPPDTRIGGTRGDCLVIPLLPQGGNYTTLENPDVWVYVGLEKDSNSASEYEILVEHQDFEIPKTFRESQPIKKEEFPILTKFNLPVQTNQVLSLNKKYRITFRCQISGTKNITIGNPLSIERKLVDGINLNTPFKKMFELFQTSNLGIDSTNLLFSEKSCSNHKDANELFELMVRKQIPEKFVPEALTKYSEYLSAMCQKK
jgi:hypothetical protein